MSSNDDVHKVREFEHPGEGRRRAKATPKGRQVDPAAAHEIEQLLGDKPRRRDLLIEYLHLIQDKYHQISTAHLTALADDPARTDVGEGGRPWVRRHADLPSVARRYVRLLGQLVPDYRRHA